MKEYIEKDAARDLMERALEDDWEIQYANDRLRDIPAADVVEARRAAWQSWEQDKPPFKWYSCDYCGFHALSRSNYCPNCGCSMEVDK